MTGSINGHRRAQKTTNKREKKKRKGKTKNKKNKENKETESGEENKSDRSEKHAPIGYPLLSLSIAHSLAS